jgi:FdhD protein
MDPIETQPRRVHRFQQGTWNPVDRSLPLEVPVAIYANATLLSTLSATPHRLADLAVGFLFTEGLIAGSGDVKDVSENADLRRGQVWVDLARPLPERRAARVTSGCGRGLTFLCPSDVDALPPLDSHATFRAEDVAEAFRTMREKAEMYRESGGLHAAAAGNGTGLHTVAEDIGRHNAVDKVFGDLLRREIETKDVPLITTGRISSEMALKAGMAGCPLVASMTGATRMAAEICDRLGVTLIVYVRGKRMDVVTHLERMKKG